MTNEKREPIGNYQLMKEFIESIAMAYDYQVELFSEELIQKAREIASIV